VATPKNVQETGLLENNKDKIMVPQKNIKYAHPDQVRSVAATIESSWHSLLYCCQLAGCAPLPGP